MAEPRARVANGKFTQSKIRRLTVLGKDPSLIDSTGVVTVQVQIPAERLAPGPQGARFHVIDCDASTQTTYRPVELGKEDEFADVTDPMQLVRSRSFHAQNAYGTAMETLCKFEQSLGRRIPWSIPSGLATRAGNGHGHVLKNAPHAFSAANAYYSRRDEGLLFGYFPSERTKDKHVFTCLSRDVIAHETTHAIVDGLHPRYTDPSSADQAAFHEGFADVVALLSAFQFVRVIDAAFPDDKDWIGPAALKPDVLRKSVLAGLAQQLGDELGQLRGAALRNSARLEPDPGLYTAAEYEEPHRRGELLVAAMMNAFLAVWDNRMRPLQGEDGKQRVARSRVVEEGAGAARHVLSMAIRALDYAPPVDIDFRVFLSAILTADHEMFPDDSKYKYRLALLTWFGKYGIQPIRTMKSPELGMWEAPERELSYQRNHFQTLTHDPDEAFHFIWENREALRLNSDAFTYVPAVNRCTRTGTDGFTVHETIIQYVQVLGLEARELLRLRLRKPDEMSSNQKLSLYGGGVLVLDEFGQLKFHIGSGVNSRRQNDRLQSLWSHGFFSRKHEAQRRFAEMHRARALDNTRFMKESW